MASHDYDWELSPGRNVVVALDEAQLWEIEDEATRSKGLSGLAELVLVLRDRNMVPAHVVLTWGEERTQLLCLPATLVDALHQCPQWLVDEVAKLGFVDTMTRAWLHLLDLSRTPTWDDLRRWRDR